MNSMMNHDDFEFIAIIALIIASLVYLSLFIYMKCSVHVHETYVLSKKKTLSRSSCSL